MALNLLQNGGFEFGGLYPWTASAANVATVTYGPQTAVSGNFFLDLETAVGNRGNTISQSLTMLNPGTTYTVSVSARAAYDYGANYCFAYVYAGTNATEGSIASEILYSPGDWVELSGEYVPRSGEDVLNVGASCTFSGSSYTGHVLFDDVVFAQA